MDVEQQIATRRKRIAEADVDSAQKKPRLSAQAQEKQPACSPTESSPVIVNQPETGIDDEIWSASAFKVGDMVKVAAQLNTQTSSGYHPDSAGESGNSHSSCQFLEAVYFKLVEGGYYKDLQALKDMDLDQLSSLEVDNYA
jgi:hypothetical protein